MLDEMRVNDVQLKLGDLRQLENADQIAHFFSTLRYTVDVRQTIPVETTTYANSPDLKAQVHRHELIATDTADEDLRIYLFEVRSVTAKLRNELARGFLKTNDSKVLLVLTANYETIEFVYLERSQQKTKRKGLDLKPTIRPIPLTVNRQNPDPVALRVLKRFTFTEEDSDYQWEKLRSAYMLAEWSEQYFNNRALFSDYYLKERLQDEQITPQWGEDVKPIGREVFRRLSSARQDYSGKPEALIRKDLFEPLFKQLGFEAIANKSGAASDQTADYLLYAPEDKNQPIAAALTYVWNRNLDDVDESRDSETSDEIPGAMVVSLLEKQIAPWVIVTNGKLWRLYSSIASNKATNYYEIDLEEAITASDQIIALKYWWLMFRREAFTGFLDTLLKNSADYAKELGDRLKDRVFVEIFPQFAKGFIADMRAKGVSEADINLDTVFSGTMTFLYRLMFTLYAESLELVPINEVQGYRELSLYRMKGEIAEAGGKVRDEAPDKLHKHYKATNSDLYARLNELFGVIDAGSDEMNMPTYNGGLFSTQTDSGKFLAQYAIPDRYLALGLDRLTRDIDTKTQALGFIDFKSLGVRQLGSIYEGLLEFKLKIASEALAVTKEKGKEIYQPAKKVKKALATLAKGDVYLENDKQERKATGSYYTPDYIVKYIVKHTVGPVLDRKFEELEKRIRAAAKGYDDYAKLAEARRKSSGKDESPANYWNSDEMRQLVDDCLNVRVLDPAMGSGHFLVEVVDYISNRLINFLNGWTQNPIWHFIDQTRQDILEDMERQHVSIDAERLTRVALLKRAVLKRCIYGVDLNAMAVELAKVSLWLDAFTLGAPLSFLDHHLKYGNSLIGARVADVQGYLKAQAGETVDMFSGSKFAGVMLATDLMRQVSYLSDNTIEQTRQSAQAYRDASDHLAPYKRVLDVYTSRWFGNAEPKKSKIDTVRLFLQDSQAEAWFNDPTAPLDNSLFAADTIAKTALQTAESKRFFHWELEFPEVFFAPSKPGGQDVQLSKDGGFDAVVGNPPYGRYGLLSDQDKDFIRDRNFAFGSADTAEAFMSFVPEITASNRVGMIVPKVFTYVVNWSSIRDQLRLANITFIADVSQAFPDVLYEQVIYGTGSSDNVKIGVATGENIIAIHETKLENFTLELYPIYLDNNNEIIFDNVQRQSIKLGKVYEYWYGKGGAVPKLTADPTAYKIVQGRDIARYTEHDNKAIYLPVEAVSANEIEASKKRKLIIQDIVAHVTKPTPRIILMATLDDDKRLPLNTVTCVAETETSTYSVEYCLAVLNSNFCSWYVYHFIYNCAIRTMHFMPGYIDRTPIPRINFTTPTDERERLTQQIIGAYDIGDHAGVASRVQTVLSDAQTDVVHDVLAHLAQQMIDLNKSKQAETKRFLTWLEAKLRIQPKNDSSNGIDSLTGKTIIQGYLGDYQKGNAETAWDDFYYRLHQNRNRFAVSLGDVDGEIQLEYEKSLEALLPIKRDLARTDALIDKIVYRLYGLTDAEIELIERPQYEQALTDAKAQVVADEKLSDDAKVDKIAEAILPAAKRFFERVEAHEIEAALDVELPNWRNLPPDAPIFLLTGDYNLRSLPDHMDFSTSVIPYMKAVEVVMHERIFTPFRQRYTEADVYNAFFQRFMRGEAHLTLGNYGYILPSSRERVLQGFMGKIFGDVQSLTDAFKDSTQVEIRNKAAHEDVLTRAEAEQVRAWVIKVLGLV